MDSDAFLDPTPYSISSPSIATMFPSEPHMYSSASLSRTLCCCEYEVSRMMEGYWESACAKEASGVCLG